MIPYGVISDSHLHKWSVFSHVLPTRINSRLQGILDEIWRAAVAVRDAGGDTLIHCGDIFHVRGSIAPSVLNPAQDLFARIRTELGVQVIALAGNHDLEDNDSNALGNAAESLRGAGVQVISRRYIDHENHRLFVPYFHSQKQVRTEIEDWRVEAELNDMFDISDWTLFLHAPLNGVIAGIPDNGFSARELADYGFKAVFCGHYHHHCVFDGNVCSVGPVTHQTFSDVGNKAGFVIVDGDTLSHHPSNAPRFVDWQSDWDELEEIEHIQGNYVRAKLESATNEEVEEVRAYLTERGAAGVQIIQVPKSEVSRDDAPSVAAGASVRVSVAEWCRNQDYGDEVITEAQALLDQVEERDG